MLFPLQLRYLFVFRCLYLDLEQHKHDNGTPEDPSDNSICRVGTSHLVQSSTRYANIYVSEADKLINFTQISNRETRLVK